MEIHGEGASGDSEQICCLQKDKEKENNSVYEWKKPY